MKLLRTAIVFMAAAVVALVVMLFAPTASVGNTALAVVVAATFASFVCVKADEVLARRELVKQRRQRIARTAHASKHLWL